MKKTLTVLLCLLAGCKELTNSTDSAPEPCPLSLSLPRNAISIAQLPKGAHYEITINNELLWNSCSQLSKFGIISATIHPSQKAITMNFHVYENLFQENTLAEVKIYKTDALCDIDPATETKRMAYAQIFHSDSKGPSHCGDYRTTSTSLYINYETE